MLYSVFFLTWICGVVCTKTTQWPPATTNGNLQCDVDFIVHENRDEIFIHRNDSIGCSGCEGWYNNTIQSGRRQISTFNNLPHRCKDMLGLSWVVIVALKDDHPDIKNIGEEIQTLPGCAVNGTNIECIFDVDVMVKKCDGDLIYYLKYNNVTNITAYHYFETLFCFERIYVNPCDKPLATLYHEQVSDDHFVIRTNGNEWYNFKIDGIQYVIPSVEDLQFLDLNALMEFVPEFGYFWMFAVEGDRTYWTQLDGNAKGFRLCQYTIKQNIHGYDNFTCNNSYYDDIYVSKCNDGVRYHSMHWPWKIVVVNENIKRPKVIPEVNIVP
ncbi:hypothetical protein ACF0H5_004705 [Mactra antiquata]